LRVAFGMVSAVESLLATTTVLLGRFESLKPLSSQKLQQ
jgi:hypothetical protein